jgi:hypothetical protein
MDGLPTVICLGLPNQILIRFIENIEKFWVLHYAGNMY